MITYLYAILFSNKKQLKTFICTLCLLSIGIHLSAQTTTNVSYTNPIFASGQDAKVSFRDGYYYYVKWAQGQVPGVDNYIYRTKDLSVPGIPVALPIGAPLSPPIYIESLNGKNINKWFLFGMGVWECSGDPYTGVWTLKQGDIFKQTQYRLDYYPFLFKGELFMSWAGNENTNSYDWGFESIFISKVTYDGTSFILDQPVASGGNMVATYSFGFGQRPQFSTSDVVVEAPAVYTPSMFGITGRDNELFMILSMHGAQSNYYAVGMIYFTGTGVADVSKPDFWKKVDDAGQERLFMSNLLDNSNTSLYDKGIKGPGVVALAPSPDNSKLYMYYHSKWYDKFSTSNVVNNDWERREMLQEIGWKIYNGKMIPDFHAKPIVGVNETGVVMKAVVNYWNFTNNLEGWTLNSQLTGAVSADMIRTTIIGADPYIHSPNNLGIFADPYKYVVVRMRNMTAATTAELFWTTDLDNSWNASKRVSFPIVANDTKQRYYIIDLSANAGWKGTIKQIRLDPTTVVTSGTVNIDLIKFVGSYSKSPIPIPGTIEAENFNNGGQNNAYYDADMPNNGGKYRLTEGVDIETTGDATGAYNIGWTNAGEWMEYLVNVTKSGTYNITLRTAAPAAGARIQLQLDGTNLGTAIDLTSTGGYQTYTDIKTTAVLASGLQILKVNFLTGGFNINKMVFTEATTAGLEDSELSNLISVYPNPANNVLNVFLKNSTNNQTIHLLNSIGEVVLSKAVDAQETTINTEGLSSGMYMLKVGDSVFKVIINK
jgi:hypothetical protein